MSNKAKSVKSVTLKSAKTDKPKKPRKIKGLKSDCPKESKVSRAEKLVGVCDIDGADEKCTVRKWPPPRPKPPKPNACAVQNQFDCEKDPLWRSYMKTLTADARKRMDEERAAKCLYPDTKFGFEVPCLPCPPALSFRYELGAFNQGRRIIDVLGPTTAGVWDSIRDPRQCLESASFASEFEWPRLYPCSTRDPVRERKILARKVKMRMLGASPCEVDEIDSPESSDDERQKELAAQKELVHARIPFTYPKDLSPELVDRDVGAKPGLVDGDYVIFQLASNKCGERTYANVCLHGTRGMPLAELPRAREHTWQFCLFQGLVALLAKTQLRYKYAWSANVDYVYDHAWNVFLHVGQLTVKPNQRFDDVLVYNYKYSVELQLVHELTKVRVAENVPFDYYERTQRRRKQLPRRELVLAKSQFSREKQADEYGAYCHCDSKKIERWFDKLDHTYTNCIFRTPRFSLAFWQDGSFWYLYNPYRCDKFGFFENVGTACFVKFCSRESLKRHLVLLTLRAYAYGVNCDGEDCAYDERSVTTKSYASSQGKRRRFSLQIYQLLHHSCRIHNVKLLLREPWKPRAQLVEKRPSELCGFDPLREEKECAEMEDYGDDMEKHRWLEEKIVWAKYPAPSKSRCGELADEPPKWHNYEIIKSQRLYILWGKRHILQKAFPEQNRGKQAATCYAVCAGMCAINTPEYWDGDVLDAVVVCGDRFYTERYKKREVCAKKDRKGNPAIDDWDERPSDKFRIGDIEFDLLAKPAIRGRMYFRNDQCLWRTLQRFFQSGSAAFAVLNCENAEFGVFKRHGVYYAIDVASYGPPIFERGAGLVYLLRAACFEDLMKNLVLIIGQPECRSFKLRPMEIVKIVDLGDRDECGRIRVDKCEEKPVELFKPICPRDKKKKRGAVRTTGGTKTFDQTACLDKDDKMPCPGMF